MQTLKKETAQTYFGLFELHADPGKHRNFPLAIVKDSFVVEADMYHLPFFISS